MNPLDQLLSLVCRSRVGHIGEHTVYCAQVDTWLAEAARDELEALRSRAEDAGRLERRASTLAGSVVTTGHDGGNW